MEGGGCFRVLPCLAWPMRHHDRREASMMLEIALVLDILAEIKDNKRWRR